MRFSPTFLILLFFCFLQTNGFGQQKQISKKDIKKLIEQGNKYFKEANFEKSLTVLDIALKNSISLKADSLSAKACNRIARNFEMISEPKIALQYYKKGLLFCKKSNNLNMQNTIDINLGNFYSKDSDLNIEKSLYFFKKALIYKEATKDTSSLVTINMNIACTYFAINKFEKGKPHLDFVNKNLEKFADEDFLVTINTLNGMYYSNLNQNILANFFFKKGLKVNNRIYMRDDKGFLYQEYSKFCSKTGDYKEAYKNLKLYNEIEDSLFDSKKIANAKMIGVKLKLKNAENELILLEKIKANQNKLIAKSRLVNILASIIILVFGLFLYVFFRNSNINKKINEKLTKKNFQLKIAVNKANEAIHIKSQFVSTISHELRTPLYGVIGITDIIYNEHNKLIDNKHLDALRFSARYLLTLVNDLLQISKIEESKIALDIIVFNLRDEVNSICNALQFIAKKNNIKIQTKIDDDIPKLISGDATRLSQILMNLMTNALKFTKDGTVNISLNLENVVDKTNFIHFEIKDSGIGIALENQEKIFENFTQINRTNDDYQGTGLGLSIVKKLIHLFKSEIYLESEVNIGSTFSFTIGFETFIENLEKKEIQIENKLDLRILVVEDNKINQLVTKKIIQQKNHYCKIVSNGFEAIEVLKKEDFDVILMDINMPELNGFETTIEIRKMAIEIPIIALTAYNLKQVIQQANLSGIDAVLVKPFEPSRLFEIINEQLNKKNAD